LYICGAVFPNPSFLNHSKGKDNLSEPPTFESFFTFILPSKVLSVTFDMSIPS
jgi:hypothetical protein